MRLPTPSNRAFGDYGLPQGPTGVARHVLVAAIVATCALALGGSVTTQWLASKLNYQSALGQPWVSAFDTPLYLPWSAARWASALARDPAAASLTSGAATGHQMSALFAFGLGYFVLTRRLRARQNRAATLHGSASWAARDDIERAGLLDKQGVVLGTWRDPTTNTLRILRSDGPQHIYGYAITGAGKGIGWVIPTLLTWAHSAIVLDLKGENYAKTSGYRRALGHNVLKFAPSAKKGETSCLNLLDTVRLGTDDDVADARRVAIPFVDPNGELQKPSSGSNHWLTTAIGLLTAAQLHILYRERTRGATAGLAAILDELADPTRDTEAMLLDWITYPHDPQNRFGWVDENGNPSVTHKIVRQVASIFLKKDPKERDSILSSTVTALTIFQLPKVARNTAYSDFGIDHIMSSEKPTTLYLELPATDVKSLGVLATAILDIFLRRLMERMDFEEGSGLAPSRHRLLLLLDELTSLGTIPIIAEAISYIRGYGIKAFVIIQNPQQLRAAYGKDEVISGNCSIACAYAPSKQDTETAEMLSKMTGRSTAIQKTSAETTTFGMVSKSGAQHEHEISRPLLDPDEVTRLPVARLDANRRVVEPAHMLAFAAGSRPVYAKQFLYFQDPELLQRTKLARSGPIAVSWSTPITKAGSRPPTQGATPGPTPSTTASPATPVPSAVVDLDEELERLGAGVYDPEGDDDD